MTLLCAGGKICKFRRCSSNEKKCCESSGIYVFTAMTLTACGHEHTWTEATCTEPKTCSECGETEGEALGHTWAEATCEAPKTCSICGTTEGEALSHTLTDANYQEAAVCTVCGETVGEPLEADFEKNGLEYLTEWDIAYPYTAICAKNDTLTATGSITFSDYQIYSEEEAYKAYYSEFNEEMAEGFELCSFMVTVVFDDDNARDYGVSKGYGWTDYYNLKKHEDDIVNYYGVDYEDCRVVAYDEDGLLNGWSDDGVLTNQRIFYVQRPIGYDGVIFVQFGIETDTLSEGGTNSIDNLTRENTILFRIQ